MDGEFGELTGEQREYLSLMRDSAAHMQQIVDELLEITRDRTGTLQLNWERADLLELVDRSIALNRPNARRKEIGISREAEVESLPLQMDRVKITQVVDNLLSNAVKYSPPRTTVTLRVASSGETVTVEVEDQGQGIPEGEMAKLFEPFARLSVKATGGEKSTGLGLAVSKRIIEGHGGRIAARSTEGQGSTFSFSLPLRR